VSKYVTLVAVLLLLAVFLGACGGDASAESTGVNQGNLAADFTLETVDGTEVALSDYRGNVVMINFWATWCPPCRAEIPDFEAAYQARQDDGFVVLGINVEEPREAVALFAQAIGMSYPVLLDRGGQVMKMYRAPGLPVSLFIDRDGVIRVRHVGFLTGEQLEKYLAQLSL
jgi:cytochrome c biogenesis protein CcmG/thiol:disulfide interchange protein DsbE